MTTGLSPHIRLSPHQHTGSMSTYRNTMDNILSSMPECTIAPLQGPPNLEYLTELNTYLNLCSASVQSNLGCGTLGHLSLKSPPAVYALLSATTFVVPQIPDPQLQFQHQHWRRQSSQPSPENTQKISAPGRHIQTRTRPASKNSWA